MRIFDWLWRRQSRSTRKPAHKMEAPPVPQGDERAPAPDPTQFMTQFWEETRKLQNYLRERGIEYQLEKDEVGFAVLWPTRSANATSLRELGERLRTWAASKRGVKRIHGLERLLEGRCPEVSATLLAIPFSPAEPESCIESVGLVTVERGANTEEIWASLCDLAEGSGVAMVMSYWEYSNMNR